MDIDSEEKESGEIQMKCEEASEMLYLYVSDELNATDCRKVSAHLILCPACRKALAETVRIAGVLGATMPRMPMRYYAVDH
ncbi:MAG: zf-HC2 domain-containing protein [Armatimonadetes bacterium]|nr:zf-HC2 domain-containing protein [Armatimonadota bacterium]